MSFVAAAGHLAPDVESGSEGGMGKRGSHYGRILRASLAAMTFVALVACTLQLRSDISSVLTAAQNLLMPSVFALRASSRPMDDKSKAAFRRLSTPKFRESRDCFASGPEDFPSLVQNSKCVHQKKKAAWWYEDSVEECARQTKEEVRCDPHNQAGRPNYDKYDQYPTGFLYYKQSMSEKFHCTPIFTQSPITEVDFSTTVSEYPWQYNLISMKTCTPPTPSPTPPPPPVITLQCHEAPLPAWARLKGEFHVLANEPASYATMKGKISSGEERKEVFDKCDDFWSSGLRSDGSYFTRENSNVMVIDDPDENKILCIGSGLPQTKVSQLVEEVWCAAPEGRKMVQFCLLSDTSASDYDVDSGPDSACDVTEIHTSKLTCAEVPTSSLDMIYTPSHAYSHQWYSHSQNYFQNYENGVPFMSVHGTEYQQPSYAKVTAMLSDEAGRQSLLQWCTQLQAEGNRYGFDRFNSFLDLKKVAFLQYQYVSQNGLRLDTWHCLGVESFGEFQNIVDKASASKHVDPDDLVTGSGTNKVCLMTATSTPLPPSPATTPVPTPAPTPQCSAWCRNQAHAHKPWTRKCTWKQGQQCGGCVECTSIVAATAAAASQKNVFATTTTQTITASTTTIQVASVAGLSKGMSATISNGHQSSTRTITSVIKTRRLASTGQRLQKGSITINTPFEGVYEPGVAMLVGHTLSDCMGPAECDGKGQVVCKRMMMQEGKCIWRGKAADFACAGVPECWDKPRDVCKNMQKEGKCQWREGGGKAADFGCAGVPECWDKPRDVCKNMQKEGKCQWRGGATEESSPVCKNWCARNQQPWEKKCKRKKCKGCAACTSR